MRAPHFVADDDEDYYGTTIPTRIVALSETPVLRLNYIGNQLFFCRTGYGSQKKR